MYLQRQEILHLNPLQQRTPELPVDKPLCLHLNPLPLLRLLDVIHSPEQLEQFLKPLADAGVDIFHASTRRFWEPEFEGSNLNLAGWTQKLTGKPTMSVGSVGLTEDFISGTFASKKEAVEQSGIDELVERMTNHEFELIAVGRALLQDPEWLVKVKEGRLNEVEAFAKKSLAKLY